jgi:hypothetical protein
LIKTDTLGAERDRLRDAIGLGAITPALFGSVQTGIRERQRILMAAAELRHIRDQTDAHRHIAERAALMR